MRQTIRFMRKGRLVELANIKPSALLLDYLREAEGSTGTKEGCGEGDCGACTVALGRLRDGKLVYEPVNACIQLLGQIDGSEVVTVEDLAGPNGVAPSGPAGDGREARLAVRLLHAGLRDEPLHALPVERWPTSTARQVNDWIAGNLCRCTGYRPIVDAALAACAGPARRPLPLRTPPTRRGCSRFLADGDDVFIGDDDRFFAAPATLETLADLYERNPDATIVAGATDVGLWITKQLRDLPKIIHVGRARGFDRIEDTGYELLIGAGATYAQVEPHFARIDPDLGELLRRLGSTQVRVERHGRRQRRQRLADRRHAAGADRARRDGRTAQGQARPHACRSRISSSTTASRTASPANWSAV